MVPNGWEKRNLQEYISIKHGFAFKSEYFTDSGSLVLLTPGSFYEDGGFRDQKSKTKYYFGDVPDGYLLTKGDMLLAMTEQAEGLLGSALFVPENDKYLHNQRLGLVQILNSSKVCLEFLYLFFNNPSSRKQITEQSTGTKVKHTSPDRLCSVVGLIPPIDEQKKIAQILSAWDQAIATTERLLDLARQQKKALMQQLLTGKKRFPGLEGEWKLTSIAQMGRVVSGGTPDTDNEDYWNGEINWLTPTDVTALTGKYVKETSRKITAAGVKDSAAKLLPPGTLLICTRATIGAMAISTTEITTNQGFKNLIPNDKHCVEFLYFLFAFFIHQFIRKASGSTFLELSKHDFEKMEFLLPELVEQQKIASVLMDTDQEIESLQSQLDGLKQEKKALMQALLTGKRRVKVDAQANKG
ncbi:restriction endonuclease subunit S [Aquitalea sp. USM4]|uniref:restriction endonuclease subunit S n=1 Tax=Aquitalea sp. USM4 TaxID=1590041 RepID=UPI0010409F29|nr:restriction endonuclease subunit S [Aquitalea sp. USM4]QBJ78383.1 restriction endonuclease subunit S [Aquitalea sp. USM4]